MSHNYGGRPEPGYGGQYGGVGGSFNSGRPEPGSCGPGPFGGIGNAPNPVPFNGGAAFGGHMNGSFGRPEPPSTFHNHNYGGRPEPGFNSYPAHGNHYNNFGGVGNAPNPVPFNGGAAYGGGVYGRPEPGGFNNFGGPSYPNGPGPSYPGSGRPEPW